MKGIKSNRILIEQSQGTFQGRKLQNYLKEDNASERVGTNFKLSPKKKIPAGSNFRGNYNLNSDLSNHQNSFDYARD